MPDSELAAREVFEEAGVTGEVSSRPIDTFLYTKRLHLFSLGPLSRRGLSLARQLPTLGLARAGKPPVDVDRAERGGGEGPRITTCKALARVPALGHSIAWVKVGGTPIA